MQEAISTSLPVILSRNSSTDHLVSNNNGFIFDKGDVSDLKGYILKLTENENLRKEMGAKGRELVEKKLSWDIIARKFLELYSR